MTPKPPAPDDPAKVPWPTQIRRQTWVYLLRRTVHEFASDGGMDAAAGLTFFAVLSVFPAGLAIVSLIGVVANGPDVVGRLLTTLDQIAPGAVTDLLRQPLDDASTTGAAPFVLVAGVLIALWSASTYVSAFARAMNRIYEVDEGRPYWKRKPAQLALTILVIALVLVIATIVVLSGPVLRAVGELLDIGSVAVSIWEIAKWPFLTVAVVVMVAVLYATTPNVRQPRFRWLSLGAVLAIVLLAGASAGFAFYVANFGTYNQTFGALGGALVFLIWVFMVNLSLLLGAEFNTELERGRQLQAGIPAEVQLQLPARDTTSSDIAKRTAHADEERGARIRQGRPLPTRTDTFLARTRRVLASIGSRLRIHK